MEKKRNGQIIIIAVLSFAILFMSIGFAAYSDTLTIEGTATVVASKWSVHFDTESYDESDGSVEATSKSIQDLAATYAVTLTKPTDFYEFTIDVVNDGTFDALLKSITLTSLDTDKQKYLSYEVKYGNSTYTTTNSTLSIALDSGASETVTVTVRYLEPSDSDDLPASNVDVSLSVALGYEQAAN